MDIQPNVYSCGCAVSSVVSITADSGCGSLRVALSQATDGTIITFSNGLGPITITSALPDVPVGVTLVGGCTTGPAVVIDGTGVSGDGLKLLGKNTLNGLRIKGFGGRQLVIPAPNTDKNKVTCVVTSKT